MADRELPAAPSGLVVQRQHELLPQLLAVVRWRRRKRRVGQGLAALLAVAAVGWSFGDWVAAPAPPVSVPEPVVVDPSPRCTLLHDDPTVLARCTVPTVVRAEWFVDDRTLQELLVADARPAGLVRIGNRVSVSAAAVDRWGSEAP